MSWYFNYYLVSKRDDGKFYPVGPYDKNGLLLSVLTKSRSFASNLWESFKDVNPENISDELYNCLLDKESLEDCKKETIPLTKKEIEEQKKLYSSFNYDIKYDGPKTMVQAEYDYLGRPTFLPLTKLPTGSYLKEGYVPILQIEDEYCDEFYPILSPHVYAEKLKVQMTIPNSADSDYDLTDFIYHKWVDFNSPEYESSEIRHAESLFKDYDEKGEIYVMCIQG